MGRNIVWTLFSIVGILHLTSGTEQWTKQNSFSKYSSQVPASSSENRRVSPAKESFDYTSGFPHGFSQGLPTFDFTGPMASAGEHKEQVQSAEQSENVGFVNGPPEGFPSLEQLGGKFPDFGDSVEPEQPSSSKQSTSYRQKPNYASPAPPSYSNEEYDDYLSGPGPSSVDGPGYRVRPDDSSEPTNSEYRQQPAPPPLPSPSVVRPPSNYNPVQASGSSPHSNYPSRPQYHSGHASHSHGSPRYQPKKAVVLKVSEKNKRVKPDYLPPGPPVFYAPSPDMQSSSHPSQDNRGASTYDMYRRAGRLIQRQKRSAQRSAAGKGPSDVTQKPEDLKTAASESETFWELTSSPFILFDTYKNPEEKEQSTSNGNISFTQGGDADGGEQRFFPSFPAPPAPYLLGPFGGGPPARAPLFPGPAANRAPSRYHPQYAGHNKFSPPPNRGPSNVYSAESHDHYQDNNLLGSGNFEVVRGGTYYGDDDDGYHGGSSGGSPQYHEHDDGDYYHHNGHSAPQEGYRLPGQDFFANFRDFADINPPSRAFSHRHEALAAEPRETIAFAHRPRQPKNILEKLENPRYGGSNVSVSPLSKDSDPMMATF
ncbi:unnamed protein product [Allacma fusca]|uniref:Uncharacterized protein n=1 Tax=Allacma fusca TaxID=39272 RepID=A0A8J2K1G3_9HEXA|nr:unnamed protein product [Allacma fusca]